MNSGNPLVEQIFAAALELADPAERSTLIQRACAGDEQLRQAVETLVAAHAQAASFMERPTVADHGPPVSESPNSGASLRQRPPIGHRIHYFGDYELLEEIATGGMGVVYKARQISLDRLVALKMIRAGQLATMAEVERFHAEAEAAAKLEHPNIVPIYEIGEHEGRHFFSMQLIGGHSLAQHLGGVPLPPRRAVELLLQIARTVHFAHQHGVLHEWRLDSAQNFFGQSLTSTGIR